MIKKIIACLTICFIITGIISPVFSDASALPQPNWSDPGISEIINISDLTGWMLNGGTYDVSTYTDAESFMNDYYSARTQTKLEGSDYKVKHYYGIEEQYYDIGDSAYVHPLDINRAISSAFRDHVGYGRRFSEQVNDALLSTGNLYDTKIPLLNEVEFANFVNYNHDALRLYSEFFTSEDNTPNPDPAYLDYITTINDRTPQATSYGTSFFWANNMWFNSSHQYYKNDVQFTPDSSYPTQFSWIVQNLNSAQISIYSNNEYTTPQIMGYDIFNVYIDNNGTNYSLTTSTLIQSLKIVWGSFGNKNAYNLKLTSLNGTSLPQQTNWLSGPSSITYSGTLQDCFDYLARKVKNVNIYVDGEPWSIVSDVSTPTITPEFPDTVGGEDLPSTTWPVYRPLAPYFITSPGMLQAIQDAIDSDGKLDIDDLKPYLTDENGDPVPDPQFDPEPVPLPVPDPVNPDVVPGLPVLPAMPPEMPGFSGVSVLAEIINFTNQSLPTSLIITFWGVVFGIVILGLIKILHK